MNFKVLSSKLNYDIFIVQEKKLNQNYKNSELKSVNYFNSDDFLQVLFPFITLKDPLVRKHLKEFEESNKRIIDQKDSYLNPIQNIKLEKLSCTPTYNSNQNFAQRLAKNRLTQSRKKNLTQNLVSRSFVYFIG